MAEKTGRKRSSPGAGRIGLRKQGKYYHARFTYQGERRHVALKVTRQDAAEKKAREIDEMLDRGLEWDRIKAAVTVDKEGTTLRDVAEEFLATDEWSPRTRRSCKSSVNRILAAMGDTSIGAVTATMIRGYVQRRYEQDGLSPASRNRELAILKKLMRRALEWGYVERNPASEVKLLPIGRKKPRPYRQDELAKLREILEPRHRAIMEVYRRTGLRCGELTDLTWADLAWDRGTLTVRDPKNHEDREIPMHPEVVAILQERRREWNQEQGGDIRDLRVYGERADIRQVLTRAMKRAPFESGRREWLRPIHSLRDSFGTALGDKGMPLQEIAELMGHKTLEMSRRYVQSNPTRMRDAVASLD